MNKIPVKQHNAGRAGGPPDAVVVHWSAGSGDEVKLGAYFNRHPERRASYNYGIGRRGGVAEYVAPSDTAWHAGDGEPWDGPDGRRVNARSVGICLCLLGPVDSGWARLHPERTLSAPHHKRGVRARLWERVTPEQAAALRDLLAELRAEYPSIRYLVGHDDVTRGKIDPGPILDGVDLGLASLGITRARRRWDITGAPWEGLDTPEAPSPSPAVDAPPAAPPAAPQVAEELVMPAADPIVAEAPAEPEPVSEPEPEPAAPGDRPGPVARPTKAERRAAKRAAEGAT